MAIFAPSISSNAQHGYIATSETTANTTYVDLSTVGPSVTVTIGSSGLAIIMFGAEMFNNTSGDYADMSFVASGANTIAIGTLPYRLWGNSTGASTPDYKLTYATLLTGLAPGSTTFKLQYRALLGGTATFQYRELSVVPL